VRPRDWAGSASAPEAQPGAALVAVMTDPADLRRARELGWYRIPVARAPRPLASEYVAFYLTAAFGQQRWTVRHFAEVLRYELRQRQELMPDQPAHPRARDWYYCLRLGPLHDLEPPLPAHSLRRLTFVRTTLAQLHSATDVRQLWLDPPRGFERAEPAWE
jgi:hypothetical protein